MVAVEGIVVQGMIMCPWIRCDTPVEDTISVDHQSWHKPLSAYTALSS